MARIEYATSLSERELRSLAEEAESHFTSTQKRVGRSGKLRDLDLPSTPLKNVQRKIHKHILRQFRPHPASACERKRGGLWAANIHSGRPYFLHLDVADHFPSITQDRVFARLIEAGASNQVAWLISRLTCLENRLPQGAPTSVAIANLVMFPLDKRLSGLAERYRLRYTRYIDDLAFSGGPALRDLEPEVRAVISSAEWSLNGKGGLVGPSEPHILLGYKINKRPVPDPATVRALRDDLRRAAKGFVEVDEKVLRSLAGRVQWIGFADPNRAKTLRRFLDQARARVS